MSGTLGNPQRPSRGMKFAHKDGGLGLAWKGGEWCRQAWMRCLRLGRLVVWG